MKYHLTWEEVVKRDDIVGGDLEINEGTYIYRGPISAIRIENGKVCIELLWAARMSIHLGESWKACHSTRFSISANALPTDIGSGRVSFGVSRSGYNIIFPKSGSKLNLKNVKGLNS